MKTPLCAAWIWLNRLMMGQRRNIQTRVNAKTRAKANWAYFALRLLSKEQNASYLIRLACITAKQIAQQA